MKKFALLMTGLAMAAIMLLSAPEAKGASDVQRFSFRQAVQAFWEFPEADGGSTFIFVSADGQAVPGSRNSRNVFIEVFRFSPGADPEDPSDDVLRSISGLEELTGDELVLSGRKLDWATLLVSIPAKDCTFSASSGPPPPEDCSDTTISADLAWTATGPLESHRGSFHDRLEGCIGNGHFSFTGRPAEVQGSVTVGDSDTNYTRDETGFGFLIARSNDQSVFVGDCFFEPPAGRVKGG
jgi:hypothetical protein